MLSVVILTHNRKDALRRCLNSIDATARHFCQVIVVDNASHDSTLEMLGMYDFQKLGSGVLEILKMEKNEGVIARNAGISAAKGDIIVQIDDDVVVHPGWDTTIIEALSDFNVGAVGVQGGIIPKWLDMQTHVHKNGYVDYLTGFFWAFRHDPRFLYDTFFGKFWHEELDLSLTIKAAEYRLKLIPDNLCTHASMRTAPVDWELHNRNLDYVRTKWENRLQELNLEGMK